MKLDDIKTAILGLSQDDQRQLLMDVLPELLPKTCTDDTCFNMIKSFVNEETAREYKEQHMGGI